MVEYKYPKKSLKRQNSKKMFKNALIGICALVGISTLAEIVVNPQRIPNIKKDISAYFDKKGYEITRGNYLKLKGYVVGEEEIFPESEEGWRFFTERLFDQYPCVNEKGSFNEWTDFFKIYNSGREPTKGIKIRFPKIDCNKDISNS